ncbi:MAG: hypothetical protein Q8R16_05325, partial [bacterium]|nr:hypothetical protein [bacterium]
MEPRSDLCTFFDIVTGAYDAPDIAFADRMFEAFCACITLQGKGNVSRVRALRRLIGQYRGINGNGFYASTLDATAWSAVLEGLEDNILDRMQLAFTLQVRGTLRRVRSEDYGGVLSAPHSRTSAFEPVATATFAATFGMHQTACDHLNAIDITLFRAFTGLSVDPFP